MAIAFRAAASNAAASASTCSLTVPAAVQAGDVMLMYYIGQANPVSLSAPSGGTWTDLRALDTDGNVRSSLWCRIAGSSDASSAVTFTQSGSASVALMLLAYSVSYPKLVLHTRAWPGSATSLAVGNTQQVNAGDVLVSFGAANQTASGLSISPGTDRLTQTGAGIWSIVGNDYTASSESTPDPTLSFAHTADTYYSIDVVGLGGVGSGMTIYSPATLPTTNAHVRGRILKGRTTSTDDDAAGA